MKKLRWIGLTAYVGKLEVGRVRIEAIGPSLDCAEVWVEMLNEFGHKPLGKIAIGFDLTWDTANRKSTKEGDEALAKLNDAKKDINDNWLKLLNLMDAEPDA